MIAVPGVPPVTIGTTYIYGKLTIRWVVTIATLILLLLQMPPAVTSLISIVDPEHTDVGPVIGDGNGFTITILVASHPVGNV